MKLTNKYTPRMQISGQSPLTNLIEMVNSSNVIERFSTSTSKFYLLHNLFEERKLPRLPKGRLGEEKKLKLMLRVKLTVLTNKRVRTKLQKIPRSSHYVK